MRNILIRGSRRDALAAAALTGLLVCWGAAGCGSSDDTASSGTATPAPSATAAALTIRDPWVKAARAGEMTAAFGVLANGTGADVTVVSAESPVSPMELHEMAMKDGKMVMRPKDGGFVIKAGGTHELSPGGDHLMLMNPVRAIEAGDEVTVTLTLADGSTVPFRAIAKPFVGAGESYAPGMSTPASPMAMGSAAP
jgi:periplasmic copper chaperone A